MAKKKVREPLPPKISCEGCIHQITSGHPHLMYCNRIKMPGPRDNLVRCIFKQTKKI